MLQRKFSAKSLPIFKVTFITFVWCIGFTIGIILAAASYPSSTTWICSLISSPQSIFLHWFITSIPFIATIVFVRFYIRVGIYGIVFLKAFTYAFSSYLIYNAFGSAGWLVTPLSMLTNTLCCLILFHIWFIQSAGMNCNKKRIAIYSFIYTFAILVDYLYITPFLTSVLN